MRGKRGELTVTFAGRKIGQVLEVYLLPGEIKVVLLLRVAAVLAFLYGLCWAKRTVRAAHECPP